MKIVSFNINSIRARPHQLIHLRDTIDPDVIGIQETKVNDPEFPIDEIKEIGYHSEFRGQKGHYGVAILRKQNLKMSKKVLWVIQRMTKKDLFKLHSNGKEKKLSL